MIWLNCPSHRPLQAPIAAQLLARVACCCRRGRHARGGAHLWADRFDGALEDAFELQDQVTSSVVSALGPTIERAEIARSFEKPTEILQAYDHYLQGLAYFYRYAKDANEKALEHFQSAARADQDYARALVTVRVVPFGVKSDGLEPGNRSREHSGGAMGSTPPRASACAVSQAKRRALPTPPRSTRRR